ncbi:hypothetical protein CCE28_02995 [Anaeromicrobium sediminis]|uniref:Uncharacterized protein n=1 Tax=Anaeromicrobium sediminis TaxID=1478221 RepID=A0A267MLN7_9FIRM|nr:hypothetical protein CCE28_02995 [Anaeromicrobium sediminis]
MTTFSIDYVKNYVTKKEREKVMKFIIYKNVFKTENGELKEIDSADVVSI